MPDAPVIFLDFDGVICTWDSYKRAEHRMDLHLVDVGLVARLQWLCDQSGAEVVVSSSWRRRSGGLKACAYILRIRGLKAAVIGITPTLECETGGQGMVVSPPRGHEIAAWITEHPRDRYVVLDDETDAAEGHEGHFVQCSLTDGLTQERAEAALRILRGGGDEHHATHGNPGDVMRPDHRHRHQAQRRQA